MLPLGQRREGEAGTALALGVEVDELAGERLGGAASAELLLFPLLATEGGELRVARVGADVAADLLERVAGHEDAVAVAVLELQVVARDAADGLRLEAEEARDAVVLVHDRRVCAQLGEARQRVAARAGAIGSAPSPQQPMFGQDRDLRSRPDKALTQA